MQINNKTCYSSRDLWSLFAAGLKALNASTDKVIEVTYSRSGEHTGYAFIGRATERKELPGGGALVAKRVESNWIKICLPRDPTKLDVTRLAQVFVHEVQHTQGYEHRDMVDCDQFPVIWAIGHIIGVRAESKRVALNVEEKAERARRRSEVRENQVRAKVAYYEKQLQRTHDLLARWKKKLAYYNRKAIASPSKLASLCSIDGMLVHSPMEVDEIIQANVAGVAHEKPNCTDDGCRSPTFDRTGLPGERNTTVLEGATGQRPRG